MNKQEFVEQLVIAMITKAHRIGDTLTTSHISKILQDAEDIADAYYNAQSLKPNN